MFEMVEIPSPQPNQLEFESTVTTTDPNATITAVEDTTGHLGYFTLLISAV